MYFKLVLSVTISVNYFMILWIFGNQSLLWFDYLQEGALNADQLIERIETALKVKL
jgi:hypothetical protein